MKNYTITKEHGGYFSARYVLAFCGQYINSFETRAEAKNYIKQLGA